MSVPLVLGLDAGGTMTRWALMTADGTLVATGEVAGLSALQADTEGGRVSLQPTLDALCAAVAAVGTPIRIAAGLTGLTGPHPTLQGLLGRALNVQKEYVRLYSDIEVAYRAVFSADEGYLVYAGTGSIAAWIDVDGTLHRAGGRGVILDDGGGGFWMAREALRRIWRREDEVPGAWSSSVLAEHVFAHIGGADWHLSRQFVYTRDRGEVGKLALAIAAAADAGCAEAYALLSEAGHELARLARAMLGRYGPRPVALGGRAAGLHPRIAEAFRDALPNVTVQEVGCEGHIAAAELARREWGRQF
jgi:glucosamine kinase